MIKNVLRLFLENSFILWWLTLVNHFFLMVYIFYKVPIQYPLDFWQHVVLILIFLSILFSYLCHFVTFKHSELKTWLIFLMCSISWQAILNEGISNPLFHFFNLLHPITSFLLIYSAISIILLGEKIGKELISVSFLLTITTCFIYFINYQLFVFLSLFTSFFLTLLPSLLFLLYGKELKNVLKYQRRNLLILGVVLPFAYIVSYVNTTGAGVLNVVWYIEATSILACLHLKLMFRIFRKKVHELKLSYLKSFLRIFTLVTGLLLCFFVVFRIDLNTSFLIVNLLLLICGICIEELIRLFHSSDMLSARNYLEVLFLKRNKMVKNLLANEDTEQQFSEFLHNEILQNIIAIKNFNSYSDNKVFGEQIMIVADDLVQRIRERMDYYQPMNDSHESLEKKYCSLIERIVKRYRVERSIAVNFPENLSLMSPYDKIVYRFIEELMTNAVKYSNGEEILLELRLEKDCIFLASENKTNFKEVSSGYGLKNMSNRLGVLGGTIDISEEDSMFRVSIVLPIDKELCYENFVN